MGDWWVRFLKGADEGRSMSRERRDRENVCVGELRMNWRELGGIGRRVAREVRMGRKRWRGLTEGGADDRGGVGRGMKGDVAQWWQLDLGN